MTTSRKPKPPLADDSWKEAARCRGLDPGLFFLERGRSAENGLAIGVCSLCAVRSQCLDYAIRNREKFGVFGGKSERARRKWRQYLRSSNTAFEADIVPVADELAWFLVTTTEIAS